VRIANLFYANSAPYRKLRDIPGAIYVEATGPRAAELFKNGDVDFALVPVGIIDSLAPYIRLPFGIASDGKVLSVAVFSETPLSELTEILVDANSRSSVRLLSILLDSQNLNSIKLTPCPPDQIPPRIQGSIGGLLIGDLALQLNGTLPFSFDLSEGWKNLTGLPMVFACWITNSPDHKAIQLFQEACSRALEDRTSSLPIVAGVSEETLRNYLTDSIKYSLTARELSGENKFRELAQPLS